MSIIKRIITKIVLSQKNMSHLDQMAFIEHSYNANASSLDDYQRCYLQYKAIMCNRYLAGRIILNVAAFFSWPLVLLSGIINRCKRVAVETKSAVLISAKNKYGMEYNYDDKLPLREIENRHGNLFTYVQNKTPDVWGGEISAKVLQIWGLSVLRHPLSAYMNFNVLVNLMSISKIIRRYNPKAIVNARVESSYVSSLVTHLCERNEIKYELFMHGELLLRKEIAFVHFSAIYLWDSYYIELLNSVFAIGDEYIVFTPQMFLMPKHGGSAENCDIIYYLSGSGDSGYAEELDEIIRNLALLKTKGLKVKLRPHPRWSDVDRARLLCLENGIAFENAKEISVENSLLSTKAAAGTYSTILLQAFFASIPVIIDDISNVELFNNLMDSNYILLSKEHNLLSEVIK